MQTQAKHPTGAQTGEDCAPGRGCLTKALQTLTRQPTAATPGGRCVPHSPRAVTTIRSRDSGRPGATPGDPPLPVRAKRTNSLSRAARRETSSVAGARPLAGDASQARGRRSQTSVAKLTAAKRPSLAPTRIPTPLATRHKKRPRGERIAEFPRQRAGRTPPLGRPAIRPQASLIAASRADRPKRQDAKKGPARPGLLFTGGCAGRAMAECCDGPP